MFFKSPVSKTGLFAIDKRAYTVYTVHEQMRGDFLNIIISNANNRPIYEQIYSQIKAAILSGELPEGELLPSIRSLAKDLRISVITTKRAYDELEKDGYIYTVAAKGCYVAEKNTQIIREEHLKQLESHLRAALELAPICGLSTGDVIDLIHMFEKE